MLKKYLIIEGDPMKEFKGFMHGVNLGGWFSQCDYSEERYNNFIKDQMSDEETTTTQHEAEEEVNEGLVK